MAASSSGETPLFDRADPDRVENLSLDDPVARWDAGAFVQFVLPSQVEYVRFDRQTVASGGRAAVEVGTLFVADGSPPRVFCQVEV